MPPLASEPLRNTRHERFCLNLAEGLDQTSAYLQAGYKQTASATANAARLITIDTVKSRLAHLQAMAAKSTEITIESIVRELDEANAVAKANGQATALVSAATLKAKLAGLMRERVEITNIYDPRIRGELERVGPNLAGICQVILREIYDVTLAPKLLMAFVEFYRQQSDEMDHWVAAHTAKPIEQLVPSRQLTNSIKR